MRTPEAVRRGALALLLAAAALVAAPAPASATWSVLVVDARTGRIVVASATCVPQLAIERFPARGLMDIQAIVVPGVGVAASQATLDRSRTNQMMIYRELERGTAPERILQLLRRDPSFESRQFGIVDRLGRSVSFTGEQNGRIALARTGRIAGSDLYYAIQGNILASRHVIDDAVEALAAAPGTVEDRVMAAMEAADAAGGDRRCSCRTEPRTAAPCRTRHALVAYLLVSDPGDPKGRSYNDGRYRLYIEVNDQNIRPNEDANPVVTLRRRYDALADGEQ
ncbi:MAG: DUF1028 domain-containing protein [Gemmatimonadetes bacterium]|nr:DUF1028 domain-containing protein [Gemmatimonadota bacterium]